QHYEEALRSTGVGAAQFTLMMVLDGFRSLAVGELAQHLVADVTTVSRNVGVLERRGFVRRTAGDDGRVRQVELTRAGRDALDRAHAGWQSVQDRLARALGPDRLRHLISELDAAAAALGDD
ncbi:MAG: MarR family transcriptional regulator, partial [Proteobacteria bacterium]|nr:MarR family transcriptional regulator [Pseudomonadota bacterium]